MLIKTRGIVLRTVKYSETSIICDVFTEALGLQSYIVSGVRKKNARIGSSLLQVMSLLDLVVYNKEGKGLQRTKELKAGYVYSSLPFEIKKSAVGLFMAELLQKTVKEAVETPELFEYAWEAFVYLDRTTETVANLHLVFMVQLAELLGFMPGGEYMPSGSYFDLKEGIFTTEEPLHSYTLNFNESAGLHRLSGVSLTQSHTLAFTLDERQQLIRRLTQFYQHHVENFKTLNTPEVFKAIFS